MRGWRQDRTRSFPLQKITNGGGIKVELRYKTRVNITGKPLYRHALRLLLDPRPQMRSGVPARISGAAALLWNAAVKNNLQTMYAPPCSSGHTRGSSVDVTLRSMPPNKEGVAMPSEYDCYISGGNQTAHSDILREAMCKAGFTSHSNEWWHYDHPSGKGKGVVDNPWERRGEKNRFIRPWRRMGDKTGGGRTLRPA